MTSFPTRRSSYFLFSARKLVSIALPVVIALSAAGCGQDSESPRKPVFGKIVGAEGKNGLVTFFPSASTHGPTAFGEFKDGAFRFTVEDGPAPGTYRISIEFEEKGTSAQKIAASSGGKFDDASGEAGGVSYGPEISAGEVEVPAGGPFEIDLHLAETDSR
jgi:hypothetical protein